MTLKVKPWGKDQGGFVLINKADFNPEVHALFTEGIEAPADGTLSAEIHGDGTGEALPVIDEAQQAANDKAAPEKQAHRRKAKE